jgi:hypothetical protein
MIWKYISQKNDIKFIYQFYKFLLINKNSICILNFYGH